MEDLELERKYLAQMAELAQLGGMDQMDAQGTDKLRHQLVNRFADQLISDPAGALSTEIHVKWWKLGYHKPIEHYRRLLKVTDHINHRVYLHIFYRHRIRRGRHSMQMHR